MIRTNSKEPNVLHNIHYFEDDITLLNSTYRPFMPKESHKRTNKKR